MKYFDQLSNRSIAVRLFLTCWLAYGLHFATNTVREIYPALSLGDHLSVDVSEYLGLHPDIFELPGRGVFINSNPGASFLGAVPYIIFRPLIDTIVDRFQKTRAATGAPAPEYETIYPMAREFYIQAYQRGLDVKFGLAAGVMQVFLMAPLSALSAVVMFYVLQALIHSKKDALLLTILFAFATPIFFRTATLNQNLLQAHFAWFAFVILWRPWDDEGGLKRPNYLLAGLLAGYTIVLDYSGLVLASALLIYAIHRRNALPGRVRKKSDIPLFLVGGGLCVLLLMMYQWSAFGSPFFPAQSYMPPSRYSGLGYQGMDWPKMDLLLANAFSPRYGLFLSAPILLLSLYVPMWFNRRLRIIANRETWFVLGLSFTFLLFTAANQFSRMQFNSGIRHMVPVTPFLFLLSAGLLLKMPRWLAWLLGIISLYWSWSLAMYRDVEQGRGIFEAVYRITTGGPQLPWLTTLTRLGYAPDWASPWLFLLLTGFVIVGIWMFQPAMIMNKRQEL